MHSKILQSLSYHAGNWDENPNCVIGEQPVVLTVNNEPWLTFMCTPIDLEAMAIGFLFNEEIIQTMNEVASVRVCPSEDNIDVWLNRAVKKPEKWARTSGCSGGKTSVELIGQEPSKTVAKNGALIPAEKVVSLVRQLTEAQELYRQTGGVHTSAISDGEKIIAVAEDIGRHNTLDKLAGRCLLENFRLERIIILTTGRISSEMIQKAGRMGAALVISRTSPSTLSVEMAEKMGITLVGYARNEHFTVYAHPERILPKTVVEKSKARQHDQQDH